MPQHLLGALHHLQLVVLADDSGQDRFDAAGAAGQFQHAAIAQDDAGLGDAGALVLPGRDEGQPQGGVRLQPHAGAGQEGAAEVAD
ncbi:MAG: hypothetical protein E7K72_22735, partial [Roseomonas mucosa]|nr:hypothetical protein [Roseomonas mucosa]